MLLLLLCMIAVLLVMVLVSLGQTSDRRQLDQFTVVRRDETVEVSLFNLVQAREYVAQVTLKNSKGLAVGTMAVQKNDRSHVILWDIEGNDVTFQAP